MLKIPVCYSFDSLILQEFQKDKYIPVGCGGYTSDSMSFLDNTGDNISKYNKYINEMSLIYWIASNYKDIGNPDFIGVAHYRRYLNYNEADVSINNIICQIESQPMSLYQTYCMYHVKSDLDLFMTAFSNIFPFYQKDLLEYFAQNEHAKCNMFIMSRELFFEYFSFIKPCISICIDDMLPLLDLDHRDRYQMRAFAFILERMTGFWIYLKQKSEAVNIINTPIVEEKIQSIYSRI